MQRLNEELDKKEKEKIKILPLGAGESGKCECSAKSARELEAV